MAGIGVNRVNFFEKQFLRAQDFLDEQAYHIALRRWHNVSHHSWGIVIGLDLVLENGAPVVRPGMAIDGYGRELVLEQKQPLYPDTFDDLGTDRLDVWLYYDRQDQDGAPRGYAGCPDGAGPNAYRAVETPRIVLERAAAGTMNARLPPGVPPDVLNLPLPPAPSDDPRVVWPVYLGRIVRDPTQPVENQIRAETSERPYAGLMGELIDHPANATRIEVGRRSTASETRSVAGTKYVYQADPDRRFAVFVPEPPGNAPAGPDGVELAPRLAITEDGTLRIRGTTVIDGNLRIAGGAVQFLKPTGEMSALPSDDPSLLRAGDQAATDELRIDLGVPTGGANKQFVIGFSTADGTFVPCLTLELRQPEGDAEALAPRVTVYGDLKIAGRLESPDVRLQQLTPEAAAAVLGSFQAGVAAAAVSG